jgi:hypothetical protein
MDLEETLLMKCILFSLSGGVRFTDQDRLITAVAWCAGG